VIRRELAGTIAVLSLVALGFGCESEPAQAPTEEIPMASLLRKTNPITPMCDAPPGEPCPGFTGCSDSDGGNKPYVFGNAKMFQNSVVVQYKSDICHSPNINNPWTHVVERICYPSSPGGTIWGVVTFCPNGCSSGKCRPL
jgi:hypothetical protein